MIALFLSPLYVALIAFFAYCTIKWLDECASFLKTKLAHAIIITIYVLLGSTLVVAFLWPKDLAFKRELNIVANYWLGSCLYIALVLAVLLLFKLVTSRVKSFKPEFWKKSKVKAVEGLVAVVIIVSMIVAAIISAETLHTTSYDISVNKSGGKLDNLKVCLVADLHMGYDIGVKHMSKVVDEINKMDADIVLLAGDIFDNDYDSMDEPEKLIEIISGIKSKYGVYACYGNHDVKENILAGFTFDYNGKKESDPRMDDFLSRAGVNLLTDESVLIDDSFYVIGRPDYEKPGRGVETRKTPKECVEGLDMGLPIIVIDHEPKELDELSDAGVDVDLCGHTHDGQTFPGNILVSLMWRNSYGHIKVGNMDNIVTSGAGLFGPNMRLGTLAEVCEINIHFEISKS